MACPDIMTKSNSNANARIELEYQLRDSEATILISSAEGLHVAVEAANKVGLPTDRVLVLGTVESQRGERSPIRPWTAIWASPEDARSWSWEKIATMEEAAATTAVINYSSGYFFLSTNSLLHTETNSPRTTGLPKGVELTHYNIVANAEQIIAKRLLVADTPSGRARRERLDTSSERWLAAVPMYHAFVSVASPNL